MPLNKGQLNISKIFFLSIFYQSLLNNLYKLQTTFFYDRLLIVNFLTLIAIFTTFSIKKALSREINRFSELLQKEGFSIMKTSVDLPTVNPLDATPLNVTTNSGSYTLEEAQTKIKDLVKDLEEHGIKIKSDEMDFEKSYQVILKIDKTEE